MKYVIVSSTSLDSTDIVNKLRKEIRLEYDEKNPDYVITVGGDGTILKAFHQYNDKIIFAINAGHLGFYTNYKIDDLDILINNLNNNTFKVNELNLLNVIFKINNKLISLDALNEITIISPLRTLISDIEIDDRLFETFRGSGLCISTPTGSTAYNKSLHGAVIDFNIEAFELTEIASINSSSYKTLGSPIVFSKNRKIKIKMIDNDEAYITIDNLSYKLKDKQIIEVKMSDNKLKIAFDSNEGFAKRLKRTFLS